MSRPPTYDHLRSAKKPIVRKVGVYLDEEYGEKVRTAEAVANNYRQRLEHGLPGYEVEELVRCEEALAAAKVEAAEHVVYFKFRSLGRKRYERLIDDNPPTEEEIKEVTEERGDAAAKALQFSGKTFPPALLAASILEPELTRDQVQEIWDSDDWSGPELMALYLTALEANQQRMAVTGLGND